MPLSCRRKELHETKSAKPVSLRPDATTALKAVSPCAQSLLAGDLAGTYKFKRLRDVRLKDAISVACIFRCHSTSFWRRDVCRATLHRLIDEY